MPHITKLKMDRELGKYKRLFIAIMLLFTIIMLFLFIYTYKQEVEIIEKLALEQANASFNKDLVYRRWSAQQGGVYVLLSDSIKPNPYLKVEEREITSTSGKTYTLINPAYMTRMVHELAQEQYQIKGHITSLDPINPQNAPDEWEKKALNEFEKGGSEYSSIETIGGEKNLRYMHSMVAEKSCLKCHGYQGYKVGDIRGGISVTVPLSKYGDISIMGIKSHVLTFLVMYVLFVVLLYVVYKIISKEVKKRIEEQRQRLEHAGQHWKIIQNAIDGFIIVDENGNIVETNAAYCKMTGYDKEELLKLHIAELEYHEDQSQIAKHIEKIKKEGTDRFETINKRKDGSLIDIEVSSLVNPFDKKQLVSFINNITERKKAKKELTESEKKFRFITENIQDVVWVFSPEDMRFTYISPSVEKMQGFTPEEYIDAPFSAIMPEESQLELAQKVTERFAQFKKDNKKTVNLDEMVLLHKNGKMVWTEIVSFFQYNHFSGNIESIGTTRDITLRKKAEFELKESEARFQLAMKASHDGIFDWDLITNEIYYSPGWKRILGYEDDELENKFSIWEELTEPKDVEKSWGALNEHLEGKRDRFETEFKMKHKNGHWVDILSRANALFDENGKPYRVVGTHVDITEIKRNEYERKKALENLIETKKQVEESEERLRFLFENMIQGVVYHDSEGMVTYANKAAAEILGLTIDQLMGKTSMNPRWHSIHEDGTVYPGEKHPAMKTLKTGKPVINSRMGVFIPEKNSYNWININSIPKFKSNEKRPFQVVVTFEDITEIINAKKQLESAKEKAENNEKQFRQLFENMEQGFALHKMIYDQEGKPADYRFVLINKAFERQRGIDASDFIGQTVKEVFPDIEQVWIDNYGKVAKTGEPMHFENYSQELEKYYDVVAYSPKEGYFATVFTDVTKNKLAEQELKKHQGHLEVLVKERTDELEASNEELKSAIEDLHEQKEELEQTLKKLNEAQAQLIQSEKMASIGVLVAGVAHEINNPVNFINSSLSGLKNNLDYLAGFVNFYDNINESNFKEVLEDIKKKDVSVAEVFEMFKKSIEIIEVGVKRTTKIVKGLKAFARSDEKEKGRYDVHENLENTLLILYNQYKEKIEVIKEYGEIPLIECYPGQINQVFMNIITNAIQSIADKGKIWIVTGNYQADQVFIEIKDTGGGIPEENLQKIFDPFFTTKKVGEGTGLGLYISFGIIKDHGGQILVESVVGDGTIFRIILPVKKIEL